MDISQKIDENHKEVGERLSRIESQIAVQTNQLGEHMRRTKLLEGVSQHHQDEIILLRKEASDRQKITERIWKVVVAVAIAYLIKLFAI